MRILLAAVAALLSFAATPASAQKWYHIAGNDTAQVYVDHASLQKRGPLLEGIVLEIYDDFTIDSRRSRMAFDCKNLTLREIEGTLYGLGGTTVLRTDRSTSAKDAAVAQPGTIDEYIMAFVCFGEGGDPAIGPPRNDARLRG